MGRLHTCYSPVRRSPARKASFPPDAPRLACVKPVASVHPEPGSNSSLLFIFVLFFFKLKNKTNVVDLFLLSSATLVCSCRHSISTRRCGGDRMSGLGNAPVCPVSGSPLFIDLFRNMTKSCSVFDSCTTSLSIVSLSMFSFSVAVLLRRKIFAKLIHHFDISKFLTKFFLFLPRTSARSRFRFSHRAGLVPESECKITAFFFNHQIFSDLFSDYFSQHGVNH